MTDFLNDWGLTLVTFIPMVGVLVAMAVPQDEEDTHKQIALVATVATAVMGVLLLIDFDYGNAGSLQYVVEKDWIDVINSRYILGLDGISLPLMALTLVIMPLCVIYSWNHIPPTHTIFHSCLLTSPLTAPPSFVLTISRKIFGVRPSGIFDPSTCRMRASTVWKRLSFFPRDVSVMTSMS